jgi:hypothetical protein
MYIIDMGIQEPKYDCAESCSQQAQIVWGIPGVNVRIPQFRPKPPIPQTTLTTVGARVNTPP